MQFEIDLEKTAVSILEASEDYLALKPLDDAEIIFRIWRYHSLSVHSSWLLYKLKDEFFVRRLEWDRTKDVLFIGESDPTIYGSETEISGDDVRRIVDSLQSIEIRPFLFPELAGIDGTNYGIEAKLEHLRSGVSYRSGFSLIFSWWSEPEASWQRLADWLNETLDYFDSILPESTAKISEANFR